MEYFARYGSRETRDLTPWENPKVSLKDAAQFLLWQSTLIKASPFEAESFHGFCIRIHARSVFGKFGSSEAITLSRCSFIEMITEGVPWFHMGDNSTLLGH